jgi:AcrR family transcriptional regulator
MTASPVVPPADEAGSGRAKRADARRNYDQLLAAAGELFAERGIETSLEEIARRANVGIGTLYRHFPNRDVLNEAVYRREVELLCDGVDELLEQYQPDEALRIWMNRFAVYVTRKRGMAVALKSALGSDSTLFTDSRKRIVEALSTLVDAAAAAGVIRADIEVDDLMRALSGVCMATDTPDASARTGRIVDLLVDGLRYRAGSAAQASA